MRPSEKQIPRAGMAGRLLSILPDICFQTASKRIFRLPRPNGKTA
ncbi:hypothetical protein [Kingella potus]|nr:hypothetical protein [Kingella potus]